jgi:hypothetical protein
MSSDVADPVSEPEAYRRMLLAALGDDDPAAVQSSTLNEARALVDAAGDLLRERPEPGEWSVLECIGHLVDSEIVLAARSRWILAEERPDIVGYDQALWVSELRHNDDDPSVLLDTFSALRRANLELWAQRALEDRDRVGLHRERGPESYVLIFRLGAGHDRIHLDQARRALDAVRARGAGS